MSDEPVKKRPECFCPKCGWKGELAECPPAEIRGRTVTLGCPQPDCGCVVMVYLGTTADADAKS